MNQQDNIRVTAYPMSASAPSVDGAMGHLLRHHQPSTIIAALADILMDKAAVQAIDPAIDAETSLTTAEVAIKLMIVAGAMPRIYLGGH